MKKMVCSDCVSGSALPRLSRKSELAAARALLSSGVGVREEVLLVVADRMLRDLDRVESSRGRHASTPAADVRVVVRSHRKRGGGVARV